MEKETFLYDKDDQSGGLTAYYREQPGLRLIRRWDVQIVHLVSAITPAIFSFLHLSKMAFLTTFNRMARSFSQLLDRSPEKSDPFAEIDLSFLGAYSSLIPENGAFPQSLAPVTASAEKSVVLPRPYISSEPQPIQFQQAKFPLRFKITLPFLVLAVVTALASVYVVLQVVGDSIDDRFTDQMVEAGRLSAEWMVREEMRLLEDFRLIAYTQGITNSITENDAEALRETLLPIAMNSSLEAIHVLNNKGVSVLSMVREPGNAAEDYTYTSGNFDLQNEDLVQSILSGVEDPLGDKMAGWIKEADGTRFYIAGPLRNPDETIQGVILLGQRPHTMVEKIREATFAQITFYSLDGAELATTFIDSVSPLDRDIAARIQFGENESYTRDISIAGIEYGEIVSELIVRNSNVVAIVGSALPKAFFIRASDSTKSLIVGVATLTVILTVAAGAMVASRLTRPLQQLVQAASEISEGNLQVNVATGGNDELSILANVFNQMSVSLDQSTTELRNANQSTQEAYELTIEGWARALELRDKHTEGHTRRVTDLTMQLAERAGYPSEKMSDLRIGAILHDIGKVGVPDSILNKPGPLNDEEWLIMRRHPEFAMQMLTGIEYLKGALAIPHSHHERWDGEGYPLGLQGEEIPIAARIFAVVDVWDALTSDRPYRSAMSALRALAMINEGSGTHFEPRFVHAFNELIRDEELQGGAQNNSSSISKKKSRSKVSGRTVREGESNGA
jgi:HD-GYP domain-containing protein (c-di-GMP phosphodiesterase class II)